MDIPQATPISSLLPMLVTDTLRHMRDSKAAGNKSEYWIYFKFAAQLMNKHMKQYYRIKLQEDFLELQKIIEKIKESNSHIENKIAMETEAKYIFADNRESLIADALPNIGIGPDQVETEIDFKKLDIAKLATLVQGKKGHISERAGEALSDEQNETEEPVFVESDGEVK